MIFYPPKSRLAFLPEESQQYLQIFTDVGMRYDLPCEILASICNRESDFGVALTPSGPTGTGDGGHGRGLMQIDDRSHGVYLAALAADGSPLWQDPASNIDMGAQILAAARTALFDLPPVAWLCAYNAGAGRVRASAPDFDRATTGRNYGTDVLGNASLWHSLARNGDACSCFLCVQGDTIQGSVA